ncbi:hypothetical protein CW745_13805 [Psychromonas sp. psych-6C06]|uniref:DUF4124 domain-containing protein n=1 Tax=Psychromonas sp. psych-6C06 TaxID=2058089 RepID=UPI000C339E21|nr:DUF4124 domain-containing protein [Psychromonas sp. psych-6C06]PKF60601.1 hypothetical protein CW745_13805 [Psychromonas sp. psych-6C06]
MFIHSAVFILILIFTAPVYAEVYKCDEDGVVRYSTTPCSSQVINLDLDDTDIEPEVSEEERFITPRYTGWKNGWQKTKDLKLERFFEIEYEPISPSASEMHSSINQQKLTNLPQSMSVQRFAISVEDIIESICANALIYQPKLAKKLPDTVFYGQYACSYKRDTKRGELGYYKIMRGENSIYMIAIKWSVDSFEIEEGKVPDVIQETQQKDKINIAQRYLKNKVKLCRAGRCF